MLSPIFSQLLTRAARVSYNMKLQRHRGGE
jgi:hypothetical protein